MKVSECLKLSIIAAVGMSLSGCLGLFGPQTDSRCASLNKVEGWQKLAIKAEKKYGTPVFLTLALIEPPLTDMDKTHVKPRTRDWDEYRIRTENWGASTDIPSDAVDFIGWYTSESVKRNAISWSDVSAHYLSYRLGHGSYYRFKPEDYPELSLQAQYVQQRSNEWRERLASCISR